MYTQHRNRITAVSEDPKGQKFAFGDEKGNLVVLTRVNEGKDWKIEKELEILGGEITTILWTFDSERLIILGSGKDFYAKAINASTGTTIGDIFGATGNVLAGDITKRPFNLFSSGESPEILNHKGVPFKGQGTPLEQTHSNYVNQLRLSPDGTKFATVSADKSIAMFDSKSQERLQHIQGAHTKGIYDLSWLNDESFVTCSADNSFKIWKVGQDEPVQSYQQAEDSTE